jgi:transcriptional pleiotropic regulator of transition state genes
MKSTGIVRKVDELGESYCLSNCAARWTLPKGLPEIYVDESAIVLKKYEPACIFCSNVKGVTNYKGKNICVACMKELKKKA